MPPASRPAIRNVSDTALWVAIYRAMESERPDAIFRDPYARRLGGERGEAIVRAMPKGRAWAWPMIVRTAVMDEIIERVVTQRSAHSVLNLAAGLDTRPYRLALPAETHWFHVDLPPLVDDVQRQLEGERPRCALEFVPADLTMSVERRELLARVARAGGPVLAVSEGLLVYLQPEQVAALARELAAEPALRYWLIDLAAPELLKMLQKKWQSSLAPGGAPMVFAPRDGTRWFEPWGWREVEFRSMWEEALRLERAPSAAWLWNLLGRLMPRARREAMRRMSGIVLLERT
ncbi:MAG TPA: class I SAM-dependent methyltransferase [Candidatus Polarisedimenticolaceae bacterium]|nr:class I SAM-dependent methyltransferase [Candidatus Polarisedimenticolaceae bacterium]